MRLSFWKEMSLSRKNKTRMTSDTIKCTLSMTSTIILPECTSVLLQMKESRFPMKISEKTFSVNISTRLWQWKNSPSLKILWCLQCIHVVMRLFLKVCLTQWCRLVTRCSLILLFLFSWSSSLVWCPMLSSIQLGICSSPDLCNLNHYMLSY